MRPADRDASLCPLYHHAIELIGRRWSGAILQVMRGGVVRFSDLAAAIPGLSDRMLSERLKELEAERLVERQVIPETPVRVEYRLTPGGEALGTVLDALMAWAHDWHTVPPAPPERDLGGGGQQEHGSNGTSSSLTGGRRRVRRRDAPRPV